MSKIWSSMKRFHLFVTFMTKVYDFLGDRLNAFFALYRTEKIGLSNVPHNLKLPFFNDNIREHKLAKFLDSVPIAIPSPDWSSDGGRIIIGLDRPDGSSKSLLYPHQQCHLCVGNRKNRMVNGHFNIFAIASDWMRNIYTTFSVQNSCKISDLFIRNEIFIKNWHINPSVLGDIVA